MFIKKAIAASLHEAFQLTTQEEDTFRLREAFKILLEETSRDIITVLCENMDILLNRYSNEHGVKYYAQKVKDQESGSTPSSQSGLLLPKGQVNSDFSSVSTTKNQKEERKIGSLLKNEAKKLSSTNTND